MCNVLGIEWSKIVRVRIGELQLGNLECGKWKEITSQEARKVFKLKVIIKYEIKNPGARRGFRTFNLFY